ncbi:TIGR02099 family protein [Alginatibacterium sediminis]|uniref:TIGR02099 family protein n=1 Tax=Alginatibacterium sediminis TaxID=2164068 RepID=A0A420EL49_9ALTE|nr:YhdP family protein [Alginatibacterium sediminis]RKF21360.1 TIGR02099 family protein [Alginatibacterium sediminis]
MTEKLWRFGRHSWFWLAILLAIFALLLSFLRLGLYFSNDFRQGINTYLNDNTELNVDIGGLDAKFYNFRPVLVLRDTKLKFDETSENSIEIGAVLIELDLWQSIDQGKLQIKDLILDNLSLDFDPRYLNSGVGRAEEGTNTSSITSLFLNQLQSFTLNNAQLNITTPAHDFTVLVPQLFWKNSGFNHQGQGSLQLFGQGHEGELQLSVDLESDPNDGRITGQWYINGDNLNVASLLGDKPELVERQLSSGLNFSLWGSLGAGQNASVQMQWQPSRISWQDHQSIEHQLKIDSAYMQALATSDRQWRVDSDDFKLHHSSQHNVDAQSQELKLQGVFESDRAKLLLEQLDVDFFAPLIDLFDPSDTDWNSYIQAGHLQQIELDFNTEQEGLSYALVLDDFYTSEHSVLPMFQGLELELKGNSSGIELKTQLPEGKLRLGNFFQDPWQLNSASAHLSLEFSQQPQLFVHQFALDTEELNLEGSARLLWQAGQSLPHMSLVANLDLDDASRVSLYYPRVMPSGVHEYLSAAIESGNAESAQVLWYGDLGQFPYAENNGMFQAMLPLRNAQFRFDPNWDALTQLDLDLLFQNDGLFMRSDSARLGQAKAQSVLATIDPLTGETPLLIEAKVTGESHKVSDYLLESPIKGLVSGLRQLRLKDGRVDGQLSLQIPLNGKDVASASGDVQFKDVEIHIAALGHHISGANGALHFENESIEGKEFRGSWKQLPLDFSFTSAPQATSNQTQIQLGGRWPVALFSEAITVDLDPYVKGDFNWKGQVDIDLPSSGDFTYSANFNSDLVGVQSLFPKPLEKSRGQKWPSVLKVSGSEKGSQVFWQSPNHVQLDASLRHQEKLQVQSIHLQLGGVKSVRKDSGLAIDINYPSLSLQPWLDLAFNSVKHKSSTRTVNSSSTLQWPNLVYLRTEIDKLDWNQQFIDDLSIEYLPRSSTPLRLQSKQVTLSAKIPKLISIQNPIQIDIEKALLAQMQIAKPDENESLLESQNRRMPVEQVRRLRENMVPWRLNCKRCEIGRYNLGQVAINVPVKKGVIEHATLDINQAQNKLNLDFDWYSRSSKKEFTRMRVDYNSQSLESFINNLGIESPILDTPATLVANLSWNDAPFQPLLSSLSGYAKFNGEQGTFTEVDDKGTRWLAIASLESVRRRLKLDFTDVFDKGLHYDSISASIQAKNGLVQNDDFYLNGGAGNLRGQGSLNFQSGLIDYRVSFSPNLTTSVAVVTAFVATPITGVAVYALSKLFEPVVDVVTRVDFQLSGNIEQPELIESQRVQEPMKMPNDMWEAVKGSAQ